jgi:hypothetical protein
LADDINALNELVKAFGSPKMNVVNIVEGAEWKTNEKGEEALRALLPHTTLDFKYLKEDGPIEGIMNFIVSSETDIVCLVKRHHGLVYRLFNTSTVNKVLSKSIKAILVLHE